MIVNITKALTLLACCFIAPAYGMQRTKTVSPSVQKQINIENLQRTQTTVENIASDFKIRDELRIRLVALSTGYPIEVINAHKKNKRRYIINIAPDVFYSLTELEQFYSLAHEMAHIYCRHLEDDSTSEALMHHIQYLEKQFKEAQRIGDRALQEQLKRLHDQTLLDYYRACRDCEYEADIVAIEKYKLQDVCLSVFDKHIAKHSLREKPHPFLTYCACLYHTHPDIFVRRKFIAHLPKIITITNQFDDFSSTQRQLIGTLYTSKHNYPGTIFLLPREGIATFKSLPKEIQEQLLADLPLRFHEEGHAAPEMLEYKEESKALAEPAAKPEETKKNS